MKTAKLTSLTMLKTMNFSELSLSSKQEIEIETETEIELDIEIDSTNIGK